MWITDMTIPEWEAFCNTKKGTSLSELYRKNFLQHRHWKNLVGLCDYTFLDYSNKQYCYITFGVNELFVQNQILARFDSGWSLIKKLPFRIQVFALPLSAIKFPTRRMLLSLMNQAKWRHNSCNKLKRIRSMSLSAVTGAKEHMKLPGLKFWNAKLMNVYDKKGKYVLEEKMSAISVFCTKREKIWYNIKISND